MDLVHWANYTALQVPYAKTEYIIEQVVKRTIKAQILQRFVLVFEFSKRHLQRFPTPLLIIFLEAFSNFSDELLQGRHLLFGLLIVNGRTKQMRKTKERCASEIGKASRKTLNGLILRPILILQSRCHSTTAPL